MATPAGRLFRRLEGLFCVYKSPGVHWKLVRDNIETNLLKGLNATPSLPCPKEVRFLTHPQSDTESPKDSPCPQPLCLHFTGPEFQRIRVGVGHRLDAFSSGVLVGNGNKILNDLYRTRVTRDYTLEGEFGTATDDFSYTGRVMERYSNVDMRSQEAYELAVQGLLGPEGKSQPILTGLRCIHFQPPNFTLEVQCLNELRNICAKLCMRSDLSCAALQCVKE
ncbi:hypothetical protein INR49_029660 [Caranx melampygus]|nr:hypothetical protein INR49_029660 [Caranx melampygus]